MKQLSRIGLGSTLAGATILLAQPNPLPGLGLGLIALPWLLRLVKGQAIPRTPLDIPVLLFLTSAGLGLAVTSDPTTAGIRWWGILAAVGVCYGLIHHVHGERWCRLALRTALGLGAFGILVVLALTQGRVARGPLGRWLSPALDWFQVFPPMTAPVMETNTRYIVNYNGLGDLCLVVAVAGILLARQTAGGWQRRGTLALVSLAGLLLMSTGGRGSILGVAAAILVLALPGLAGRARRAPAPGSRLLALTGPLVATGGLLLAGLVLGQSGIIDKGLQTDSLGGRAVFWRELVAMLGDHAFTGLGLGMQAPLNAIVFYGLTPRWDAMAYAHNMFLQTYLEQGPVGAVSLFAIVVVAVTCGVLVRRQPLQPAQRAVAQLGLAVVVGLTVHGLTDQVPTTNFGTLMLLAAAALTVGPYSTHADAQSIIRSYRWWAGLMLLGSLVLAAVVTQPQQPADLPSNLGALEVAKADSAERQLARETHASRAERLLGQALAWSPDHVPALRHLARLKLQQNDLTAAARLLETATTSGEPSPFDAVQIGRLYYQLGFLDEGYRWTRWGYEASGGKHQAAAYEYYRLLLDEDWRVRTLVEQGEMLRDKRQYVEALPFFQQALRLAPDNRYLIDQVEEVGRAAERQS